jgi:hypothetical protein
LKSQREQIKHLFEHRPELAESWWHVALIPVRYDGDYECHAVITWEQVTDLANEVLGSSHYVTVRLKNALDRYSREFGDHSDGARNYDGIRELEDVLSYCRQINEIEVGHTGGESDLRRRGIEYAKNKPWKWRNPKENRGVTDRRNWMRGDRFLKIIEEMERISVD